ncbi:unnamed protein product, partial [Prorocentrum cordatum]
GASIYSLTIFSVFDCCSSSRLLRGPQYTSEYCRPKLFFPFLEDRALWPSNDEVSAALVERWRDIREEFREVMSEVACSDINTRGLTARGQWSKVPLFSHGVAHEGNLGRCPVTASTLAGLPLCRALGSAYFSRMAGGTAVRAHFSAANISSQGGARGFGNRRRHVQVGGGPDTRFQ